MHKSINEQNTSELTITILDSIIEVEDAARFGLEELKQTTTSPLDADVIRETHEWIATLKNYPNITEALTQLAQRG